MSQTGGDRRAVEVVMNHRHMVDMFPGSQPARDQVVYLGRLLREIWSAKLQRDFPGRRLVASFSEERSEDLLDYENTAYQDRDAN